MGTGKGLLDSLIAEGGVDIEILGGVGVIGLQLNFTAIPTSLFI